MAKESAKVLTPETMKRTSNKLVKQSDMVIKTQEDAENAVELLCKVAEFRKKLEEMLSPQVDATYKAWKIALDTRKQYVDPVKEAEKKIKDAKSDFDVAEEERIENKRMKELEKAKKVEDKKKKKIQDKIDKTDDDEIKAALEEEMDDVHVPVKSEKLTSHKGMARQKDFDVEVVNKMWLLKAIASGEVKLGDDSFEFKKSVLKAFVKATGVKSLAGCKIVKKFIQKMV